MADSSPFSKFVPGFDFLQGLVKNANAAMPAMGQWIAPTLDPAELDKRIEELRTVQFWLEQNARLLGATIQALEVQRMTLSTLKSMNVSIGEIGEALKVRPAPPAADPRAADEPPEDDDPPPDDEPPEDDLMDEDAPPAAAPAAAAAPAPAAAGGAVDPMQWWGALTRQFTDLAAAALKDGSAGAAIQQSIEAAGQTLKAAMPGAAAAPAPAPAKAPAARPASRAKAAARPAPAAPAPRAAVRKAPAAKSPAPARAPAPKPRKPR